MTIIIGVLAVILYGGLTYYIGRNLLAVLQAFGLKKGQKLYWTFLFLWSFSPVFGMLHETLQPFKILGNYWMFFFEYGFFASVIGHLVYVVTKKRFLKWIGGTAIGTIMLLFIVGTYMAYTPTVRETTIELDKEIEPLRVVVASDFHLGVLSNHDHLRNFVQLTNEANADIVLLVGDLVDDDPRWFVEEGMAETLAQLEATHGVYAVLGNHEYYGGKIDELVAEMERANVHMLVDETVKIADAFYVTGQEDITNTERATLESLKPQDTLPWFVLNHTPNDLETPAQLGVDVHMSGHTHKGQLWPNEYITNAIFEVDYGHEQKEEMHVLVSSGYGFWGPPMRIGSQSELWIVDINTKQ